MLLTLVTPIELWLPARTQRYVRAGVAPKDSLWDTFQHLELLFKFLATTKSQSITEAFALLGVPACRQIG
jgi:hypothetical protein